MVLSIEYPNLSPLFCLEKHTKVPHPPQDHSHLLLQFKASCCRENFFFGSENLTIQIILSTSHLPSPSNTWVRGKVDILSAWRRKWITRATWPIVTLLESTARGMQRIDIPFWANRGIWPQGDTLLQDVVEKATAPLWGFHLHHCRTWEESQSIFKILKMY